MSGRECGGRLAKAPDRGCCRAPVGFREQEKSPQIYKTPLSLVLTLADSSVCSIFQVALEQGVDYNMCLKFVKEAREQGLKAPVILMGALGAACDPGPS